MCRSVLYAALHETQVVSEFFLAQSHDIGHELLAPLGRELFRSGLADHAYDRFRVRLAQMNPPVGRIYFQTVTLVQLHVCSALARKKKECLHQTWFADPLRLYTGDRVVRIETAERCLQRLQ